jgi:hypothetical protein
MKKKIFIFIICVLLAALSGGRATADAAFIRDMMEKKEATLADGCRAVYYFSGGDENEQDIDKIVAYLLKMKYIKKSYPNKLDRRFRRGQFAYMLCRVLDIKGGLTMRIIGTTERYALRELIYMDMMPRVNQAKYVSGIEILGVLSRAERYRSEKQAK